MRFSYHRVSSKENLRFDAVLTCRLHSKQRVDERRYGRTGCQKDQSAQCEEHDYDREQPKFLPLLQKTPELQDKVSHVGSPFVANGLGKLVLMVHMGWWPLAAGDPICFRMSVEVPPHGVIAYEAQDGSNGYEEAVVRYGKDDSRI